MVSFKSFLSLFRIIQNWKNTWAPANRQKPPTFWKSYTLREDINTTVILYCHDTLRNDRGDAKKDDFWYTCLLDFITHMKSSGCRNDEGHTKNDDHFSHVAATSFHGCKRFSPVLTWQNNFHQQRWSSNAHMHHGHHEHVTCASYTSQIYLDLSASLWSFVPWCNTAVALHREGPRLWNTFPCHLNTLPRCLGLHFSKLQFETCISVNMLRHFEICFALLSWVLQSCCP